MGRRLDLKQTERRTAADLAQVAQRGFVDRRAQHQLFGGARIQAQMTQRRRDHAFAKIGEVEQT